MATALDTSFSRAIICASTKPFSQLYFYFFAADGGAQTRREAQPMTRKDVSKITREDTVKSERKRKEKEGRRKRAALRKRQ